MSANIGSLITVNASSTQIQILSLARLAMGTANFFTPSFIPQRVYGFSNRTLSGSSATASNTSVKAGSAEELTLAVRLAAVRDIALGLLLRDSAPAVVERAVQVGFVTSLLEIAACGYGFVEGTLSREVATAVGGFAALTSAYQFWILNR